MQPREASPAILVVPGADRLDQGGVFPFGPIQAAEAVQAGFQGVGRVQEVAHVVQGVPDLGVAQGAASQSVRVSPLETAAPTT